MKTKGPIPDRWLEYKAVGKVIEGTRIIAFKVPLKEELCKDLPDNQKFTPRNLLTHIQDLGLVIDLTNTKRYYNPTELGSVGYCKIFCEGHKIPNAQVISRFHKVIDDFLTVNTTGLVGVHCTHGLNRTGYLVCRYLIEKMKLAPSIAIQKFEEARGHKMERVNYLNDLRQLTEMKANIEENLKNVLMKEHQLIESSLPYKNASLPFFHPPGYGRSKLDNFRHLPGYGRDKPDNTSYPGYGGSQPDNFYPPGYGRDEPDSTRHPGYGRSQPDNFHPPGYGRDAPDNTRHPGYGRSQPNNFHPPSYGRDEPDGSKLPDYGKRELDNSRHPAYGKDEPDNFKLPEYNKSEPNNIHSSDELDNSGPPGYGRDELDNSRQPGYGRSGPSKFHPPDNKRYPGYGSHNRSNQDAPHSYYGHRRDAIHPYNNAPPFSPPPKIMGRPMAPGYFLPAFSSRGSPWPPRDFRGSRSNPGNRRPFSHRTTPYQRN